jgi:hypothetical protein
MIRRVDGIELDGSSVTFTYGKIVAEVADVDYSDDITTAVGTSLGYQSQRYRTAGLYKTGTLTVTFRASVYRADVLPKLGKNGYGNIPKSAIVSYKHPQLGTDSDLLTGARILGQASKVESGEKALMIPIKFEVMQIFWGEGRATLNYVPGFPQLA